jgi:hypothetical protein
MHRHEQPGAQLLETLCCLKIVLQQGSAVLNADHGHRRVMCNKATPSGSALLSQNSPASMLNSVERRPGSRETVVQQSNPIFGSALCHFEKACKVAELDKTPTQIEGFSRTEPFYKKEFHCPRSVAQHSSANLRPKARIIGAILWPKDSTSGGTVPSPNAPAILPGSVKRSPYEFLHRLSERTCQHPAYKWVRL